MRVGSASPTLHGILGEHTKQAKPIPLDDTFYVYEKKPRQIEWDSRFTPTRCYITSCHGILISCGGLCADAVTGAPGSNPCGILFGQVVVLVLVAKNIKNWMRYCFLDDCRRLKNAIETQQRVFILTKAGISLGRILHYSTT